MRLCHREGSCVRFRTLGLLGQPMCNRRSSCRTCLQLQALAPTRFAPPKRRPVLKRGPHGTKHKRRSTKASRISLKTREAANLPGLWRPVVRLPSCNLPASSASSIIVIQEVKTMRLEQPCRIHACSSLISVAIARAFRKHVGGPLSVSHTLTDATQDMKGAFRQISFT